MTVLLINYERQYIGLSMDLKPTEKILVGSTFYETDTGKTYVFDGIEWVEK
jgi:hypothetical protein